jgi:pimeloyl-ACP methyl ester carboxylesterase
MTQIKLRVAGVGPPMLLLHAFPLHSGMWDGQLRALGGHATLLAPDLPGFGGSAEAPAVDDLDELARLLYEEAREHAVERVTVAGCSMGGYLAFALLRVAPDFVAGLALINTRSAADSELGRANRLAMVERVQREGSGFLVNEWPASALSPITLSGRPAVLENVQTMVAEATPRGIIAAQRAMATRPDSTPLLADLRVPTVVVHGLDDRIIGEAEARAMASAIPNAKFFGVPGAGHLPNLEQERMVNDALLELVGARFA